MIILSLNCRGLGLDAAVGELRDLCRSYNPEVVFLCETKKRAKEMDKLKWSLGFTNGVAVDCCGRSGGLALWWRQGVDITVRPWCQYFIDAKVLVQGKSWRFTGVYGEPRTDLRAKTWDALRFLKAQDDLPWLCAGDFNEVLAQHEHQGVNLRSQAQMTAFRDCLDHCELTDLGYKGYDFTWNNKREGSDNVQCRLDRGTATASFLDMYPLTQVEHVITEESDHLALIIRVDEGQAATKPPAARGFLFEEMWLRHEAYEDMVETAWENRCAGSPGITHLWRQLREVSADIKCWSFEVFGSVRAEIKRLKSQLESAREKARLLGTSQEVRELEKRLHDVFEQEEIMYK
jgi:exonuclease III